MEGHLTLSKKERERKSVFEKVKAGRLTRRAAADCLGLSYRHCRRSYGRFARAGDDGLVHRSRGRSSTRDKGVAFRDAVVARYVERYEGFGPTLAAEKLAEDGFLVDHETLRRWLIAAGHWTRQRRERKKPFGELIQMDGSHHQWFGEEYPRCCLLNLTDDATGRSYGLMAEEETSEAAMPALWQWIELYGVFQAKGRVERKHGVYQDRFVKELKLDGVTTIEGANQMLTNGFCADLNGKFAKPPASKQDYHRPVPKGIDLAEVFCFEDVRVVQNDWTVRHENTYYQIEKNSRPLPRPKDNVVVRRRLDGRMVLLYKERPLNYRAIAPEQRIPHAPNPDPAAKTTVPRKKQKPAPGHPWRRAVRTQSRL